MKRFIFVLACACATASRSSFDLVLSTNEHVNSGARVSGSVNNAGMLSLNDPDIGWSIHLALDGMSAGSHKANAVVVRKVEKPGIFNGACTVVLDNHETSNGDIVRGTFTCKDLTTSDGDHLAISVGDFKTFINDAANDLSLNPPPP